MQAYMHLHKITEECQEGIPSEERRQYVNHRPFSVFRNLQQCKAGFVTPMRFETGVVEFSAERHRIVLDEYHRLGQFWP